MSEADPQKGFMPQTSAPALGYSIIANLGDNRQMTVQCFVDSDEPLTAMHAKIDKAQAVVDRQRAKYELKDLLEEREKHVRTLNQSEEDVAKLEAEFESGQARADVQIGLLGEQIAAINKESYARGRQGGPVGADKARASALAGEQKALMDEKAKQAEERKQALQNYLVSHERFTAAVADYDRKIAEARALIGD